jgi:rhodanese-related sulfurtransferase
MASHDAARRAAKAGFTRVWVMPAGIDGWVRAGKPVEKS